jgi:hypothetical protein
VTERSFSLRSLRLFSSRPLRFKKFFNRKEREGVRKGREDVSVFRFRFADRRQKEISRL